MYICVLALGPEAENASSILLLSTKEAGHSHRYEDKDRLMATKTVVLEYLGRCDTHMCMRERGGHPAEREEAHAVEPEVLSSSLSSDVCAVLGRVLSPTASVSQCS